MKNKLLTDRAALFIGDAAHVGDILAPNSVDAIVTDPPAGIGFMGREWDRDKGGRDEWVAWLADVMRKALHVLKPGGHALVWALPRTSHWTATALEDAGFEVRDIVTHLFGSGFPKSLNVSKAIDDAAGAQRVVVGPGKYANRGRRTDNQVYGQATPSHLEVETLPATDAAREWAGWGTALKPAAEHWILCRKPLSGTVAANVLEWRTGALNIDGCRIPLPEGESIRAPQSNPANRVGAVGSEWLATDDTESFQEAQRASIERTNRLGRWPTNVTLDERAAKLLDAQSGVLTSGANPTRRGPTKTRNTYKDTFTGQEACNAARGEDSGGASRFYYVAKPSRAERDAGCDELPLRSGGEATGRTDGSAGLSSPRAGAGRGGNVRNHHPTVKSLALMRWLCRLVTPPGGAVLDPFAGSGSTGVAALAEGFEFVGVEQDPDYAEIASARLRHALGDG